jgi:hypothetical protein
VGYMIMNVVPFPKANGMSFHDIVIGKAQTQPKVQKINVRSWTLAEDRVGLGWPPQRRRFEE